MKVFAILLLLVFALDANAQTTLGAAPQPLKLGDMMVIGSLCARGYVWDWFKPIVGNNEYQYSGNILRFNLAATAHGTELDAEFSVPFMLDLPTGAMGTGPQQGALGLGANYFAANNGRQNVV